jgi:AcrR family transcriptional regulator
MNTLEAMSGAADATIAAPAPTTVMKKAEDHRTRVAAGRREKMRARLIESAMLVFARRGVEGTVIDEVITTAEVSRGTFYHYFRTNEELLAAVAEEVGNQMLQIIDPVVRAYADPVVRVACGVRLSLTVAKAHPHLAAFMVRVGPPALGVHSLATEVLRRDIAAGAESGRFAAMHPRLAFDLVTGPVLAGFHTLLTARVPDSYPQDMAQAVLLSLGVAKAAAAKAAHTPLDGIDLPPDSLLVRAQVRAAQVAQA